MSRLSQYCYLTFSCAVLTRFFCLRRSIVLTPCFASRISGSHGRLLLDIAHVASVRWNSRVDTSLEYARSTRLSFLKEPTLPPNMRSYRLFTVLNSSLDRPGIDEHWRGVWWTKFYSNRTVSPESILTEIRYISKAHAKIIIRKLTSFIKIFI